MKAVILRRVVYRPSDTDRLTWAVVLSQNAGLSLLFVPRRSDQADHSIAIAAENIQDRLFEPVNGPQFPMEDWDLARIGEKLSSLGEAMAEPDVGELLEDLL
jgi:hypothetical protein